MIAVVRIHGQVGLSRKIEETLKRLRIRKKYNCVFIKEEDKVRMGMVKKVKDYVMYGFIEDELLKKIISRRGELVDKSKKIEKNIDNIKPWIRLHPPRGGFRKSTKLPYPKGILGKNKDISKYLEKMI